MFIKLLYLLIFSIQLNAITLLKNIYFTDTNEINISHIIDDVTDDKILYKIDSDRYTKRVSSKVLIKKLASYGYKDIKSKHSYINLSKKSPIDTSKISQFVKKYYKDNYENIDIRKIQIYSRGYVESIPQEYIINIKRKNYLSRKGMLSIKTSKNKKIFFNYTIDARVPIYLTRTKVKKDSELSALNTKKKSIILDKFQSKPIQTVSTGTIQSKYNLRENKILTYRNTESLDVVRKNSYINVSLSNSNMNISCSAKALQSGKIGDTITVEKSDKKRLKVKIVAKNRAEIR